ncbi:MAG: FAD-binding oxidoreductase [Streptosporangiaceae bacterium]
MGSTQDPDGLDRRNFLTLAGTAAGAVTAAVAIGGCAPAAGQSAAGRPTVRPSARSAGGGSRPPGTTPGPRPSPSPAGPPGRADWAALAARLSTGRLLRPGAPGYGTARLLYDPRFDNAHPAGVAYCAVPADVSACLAFVRRFGLGVAARSGGHSYGGWSTSTGLVIDVTQMSRVSIDAAAGTARVGAGTLLIDLYAELAGHGLAVPAGSCPTVGIAGLALGGGVGVVGRLYGLTCDNVLGVQIVTADGVVRECGPGSESDLYWACRGGGGGSFGVVTEFTLRTHPAPDLVIFYLTWPWSQAAAVIAAWQRWAPTAPDALWSNLHLAAAPGGQPMISVGGAFAGSQARAGTLLAGLYAAAGSTPSSVYLQRQSYLDAMRVEAGCGSLSVPQCHLPSQNPDGVLSREPSFARSDFYTRPLPAAGIAAMLAQVERMTAVSGAPGASGGVAFDSCGGAMNRVSPDATAFVHRGALFLAQYSIWWTPQRSPGDPAGAATSGVRRLRAWLDGFYAAMRPYASGEAYQNYADPGLADWERAYYGANYPRLQRVKAAVDPGDLFRFPQSVRLPGSS